MPEFRAAINERSFGAAAHGLSDSDVLSHLARALLGLRGSVAVHDRASVLIAAPPDIGSLVLPTGTNFIAGLDALKSRDDALAQLLLILITDGPWFNEPHGPIWSYAGKEAGGLSFAINIRGLAISLNVPPWQNTKILVGRASRSKYIKTTALNVHRAPLSLVHLAAIKKTLPVLPAYENQGHHDPDGINYVPGKAHLPTNAEFILQHAIPAGHRGSTWWASCEHGFYHRFSGSHRASGTVVHWNGTTNPNATQVTRVENVPSDIRARLSEIESVTSCGCREL